MKKNLEQPSVLSATDDKDVVSQPENLNDNTKPQNIFDLDYSHSNSLKQEDDNDKIGNIPSKDGILSHDENLEKEKEKVSLSDLNDNAEQNVGSENNLGKFKDVQSLLNAYNSLQAEFTRKSQKLSSVLAQAENASQPPLQYLIDKKMEDFEQKFLPAKQFRQQLKDRLNNLDNIADAENMLKDEYITILQSNVVNEKSLAADERFLEENIFCNKKICDKIVARYVLELKTRQPVKFNGSAGYSIPLTPHNRPISVKEAGELAKNIIKKN